MLLFRVLIPANTFQDLEDGDTRDLSIRDLQQLTWATFQPATQEILALPTEENIGIYIHLSRTFHKEFTASLAMVEPNSW